jgi:hypothetical protein
VPFAASPVATAVAHAAGRRLAGVRKADAFGASCMQNIVDVLKPWIYDSWRTARQEDACI